MATYFPTSNDAAPPMLYPRESLPSSYSEAPILSSNMMMYMDHPSSSGPCNIVGSHHGEQDFGSWGNNRNEMSFLPPTGEASYILHGVQNWHGEGLSLGLNTQIPSALQLNSVEYQNPNSAFSSFSSPYASLTTYDDENSPNKQLRNSESLKMDISPYGMSSISRTILNSRYLKAAQQLLDEVVNVKKAMKQCDGKKDLVKSFKEVDGKLNVETTLPTANGSNSTKELSAAEKQDLENKLAKLLSLMDEVDRRYRRYYHQMQIVVTSFDAISGNGAANSYTSLALQTISRHFRCLRDAITGQIKDTRGSLGEEEDGAASNSKGVGISRLRYLDQHLRQQRAIQQLGMMQQHAWRPQRGLPESSVSILRAWLFEHFLHPYPKDSEKVILAKQAGLTRSQVSNWFINARVRLWKPMVEDMYKEEIGDAEMDSNSSSEVAPKATTSGIRASEDGGEDLKPSATSKATEQSSIIQNIAMAGITSDATFQSGIHRGAETEYGLVKSRGEQRLGVDESSLFPHTTVESNGGSGRFPATAAAAYHHTWELGRFGNGSGVSLTLGLQHCEGGFVTMRNNGLYNAPSPSAGPEAAADFEHRFGSSHLLH